MKMQRIYLLLLGLWLSSLDVMAAQSSGKVAEEFIKARDPFKAPSLETIKSARKGELELLPLDSFKMTGVLTGPDRLRALVQTPDGKTYLVSEQMRMGTQHGVVKKITPDAIIVREKLVNILGEEEYMDSEVPLVSEKMPSDGVAQTQAAPLSPPLAPPAE